MSLGGFSIQHGTFEKTNFVMLSNFIPLFDNYCFILIPINGRGPGLEQKLKARLQHTLIITRFIDSESTRAGFQT